MAIYYVSTSYTGATSNGGASTPWKSLANVNSNMSLFQPGDQILLKRGDTFSGTLNITRSGNSSARIIFGAYGSGSQPKLTGTGSSLTVLISMYSRSYITIQDWTIADESISAIDRTIQAKIQRAIVPDSSSNVTITRCNFDRTGCALYTTGDNTVFTYCTVENMRMIKNTNDGPPPGADDDYGANGVIISSSNNTITNNVFEGCWADSYDYEYDGGAVDIYADVDCSNNFIGYNTFNDCNGVIEIGGSGGRTVTGTVLAYNKCTNNGSFMYVSNSGTFATNVINTSILNNVIVETQPFRVSSNAMIGYKSTPSVAATLTVKNNVFQLYGTVDVYRAQWNNTTLIHENNVYKLNTSGTGSLLNITANPSEIVTSANFWTSTSGNAKDWNFSPLVGSVLINAGTNVGYSVDFAGVAVSNPPEIGILEYVAGTTTTTSSTSSTSSTSTSSTSSTSTTSTTTLVPTTTTTTSSTSTTSTSSTTTTSSSTTTTSSSTTTTTTINQPIQGTVSISGTSPRRRVSSICWNISTNVPVVKYIERMTNNVFKSIYTIPGGYTTTASGCRDIKLSLTINTFRIKVVDTYGNIRYSQTVSYNNQGFLIEV